MGKRKSKAKKPTLWLVSSRRQNTLTSSSTGRNSLFGLPGEIVCHDWVGVWQEGEMAVAWGWGSHCIHSQEVEKSKCCYPACSLLLLSSGPLPLEWCHQQSGCGFPPQYTKSGHFFTHIPRDFSPSRVCQVDNQWVIAATITASSMYPGGMRWSWLQYESFHTVEALWVAEGWLSLLL